MTEFITGGGQRFVLDVVERPVTFDRMDRVDWEFERFQQVIDDRHVDARIRAMQREAIRRRIGTAIVILLILASVVYMTGGFD